MAGGTRNVLAAAVLNAMVNARAITVCLNISIPKMRFRFSFATLSATLILFIFD
jgi:hypothetical protein